MAESAALTAAKAEIRRLKREIRALKAQNDLGGLEFLNTSALERSLAAIELTEANAALVQSLRTIAAALDSGSTNSQLFREYREGWRELVGDHDEGDEAGALLSKIRDEAARRA